MKNLQLLRRAPLSHSWLALGLGLLGGVGCGGSGGGAKNDAGNGTDTGSGACTTGGGNGTLSVKITGTTGSVGSVAIGGAAAQTVTAPSDLTVAAGAYTVTAARVGVGGAPLVRTAFEPSVDVPSLCVQVGQTTTVTVTYTAIPTSNRLWAGNSTAGKEMLGFNPGSLAASGSPAADIAAGTVGSGGFTFDKAGNLWVINGVVGEPPLARYPASRFGTSGGKTADITLSGATFGTSIPGPKALAFDAAGNLWISLGGDGKVIRLTPSQIAATGTPTAGVVISGIAVPSGIAFDQTGNLFVASDGVVVRINQARLAASGTGADLTITANSPPPVVGPLPSPLGLAFDGTGNLWANFDGTLARLTQADLGGTGPKTVTPAVQIGTDVASLPDGIAFDEQGGLWLAYSMGKLARLAPAQLTASATVAPAVVVSSADVGYGGSFAIYPAPATSPLAHRLP